MLNTFKALSDETRLRIITVLFSADQELCVCDLMEIFNLPQYAVSRHMKDLKNAGLCKSKRKGKFVYYSPVDQKDAFYKNLKKTLLSEKHYPEDMKNLEKRILEKKNIHHCE